MTGGLRSPLAYRESPTQIFKCTPPFLGIYRFYVFNILTLLAPTQSADNMFHKFMCFVKMRIPSLHASLLM